MQVKAASFLLSLAALASQAQAAVVTFTDRNAFLTAAGASLTVETFDDLSLVPGVTLSTGGGYQNIWNVGSCPGDPGNPCVGLIETASATFNFSPSVKAVGFDYGELNLASLNVMDSAGHLFNAALTATQARAFFGVISDVDLNWISIGSGTSSAGAVYFIDDLRFGATSAVPLPGTLALVGLGLAALGWRQRRSRG